MWYHGWPPSCFQCPDDFLLAGRLGGSGDHVLDEVAVPRGVDDGVMPLLGEELLKIARGGKTTFSFDRQRWLQYLLGSSVWEKAATCCDYSTFWVKCLGNIQANLVIQTAVCTVELFRNHTLQWEGPSNERPTNRRVVPITAF